MAGRFAATHTDLPAPRARGSPGAIPVEDGTPPYSSWRAEQIPELEAVLRSP